MIASKYEIQQGVNTLLDLSQTYIFHANTLYTVSVIINSFTLSFAHEGILVIWLVLFIYPF